MAQAADSMSVEPGKQQPQSVVVRTSPNAGQGEVTVRFMLFTPEGYRADGKPWPLMLFLHGLGECSKDDLSLVNVHGPASFVDERPDFPFIVVTPQSPRPPGGKKGVPTAWKPVQLIQLLDHVSDRLNVDRTRVYCTGLSMGGYGTWRMVSAYPERFAAAVPICGGGEPATMAGGLRRVPIWAFHGARDKLVPLCKSQEMVRAVRRAGGNVKLTVYPDVKHDSWKRAYDNPEVYEWLLSHRGPLP